METEDLIEIAVERKIDSLDRKYMKGEISTEEYEIQSKEIYKWCEDSYKKIKKL